ncbi:MAG: hypothetical protein M1833_005699 [Piccolia ochrophora]|nr:MAG: hypothetical protein M1833_005699 [Piccolia ochrophora]
MTLHPRPKALFFDVFGTVVDWRTPITNALSTTIHTALSSPDPSHTIPASAHAAASALSPSSYTSLANQWRASYYTFTSRFDPSAPDATFVSIDEHNLASLRTLLAEWGLAGVLSDAQVGELSRAWRWLDPWPDAVRGLQRLNRAGYVTATLSNGNVALLEDMARYAGLKWGRVLSAEMFGAYKPRREVYEGAMREVGVETGEEAVMVAAHLGDLKAAKGVGMRAVYVEREGEEQWSEEEVKKARREGWVDVWIGKEEEGFLTLADRLDVSGDEGG